MVLEGVLEINYGKSVYVLEKGDTIYYDSIVPHHVHALKDSLPAFWPSSILPSKETDYDAIIRTYFGRLA